MLNSNVDMAEVLSSLHHQIDLVVVARKDVSSGSFDQEVDYSSSGSKRLTLSDILSFFVDVVLLLNVKRSHESADPDDEGLILSFEKVDCLIDLLMNLHC